MNRLLTPLFVLLVTLPSSAVTLQFIVDNPIEVEPLVGEAMRLNSGTDPVAVGSRVELGYFDGDTASFSGNWVTLGIGSLIGGGGSMGGDEAGYLQTVLGFDSGDPDLPPEGTLIALRFFDSLDDSGKFNTVTEPGNLQWTTPVIPDPPLITPRSLEFFNAGFTGVSEDLVWEDDANPFTTTITSVASPADVELNIEASGDDLIFTWKGELGKTYDLVQDPVLTSAPETWSIFEANIDGAPLNSVTLPRPTAGRMFFAVREQP